MARRFCRRDLALKSDRGSGDVTADRGGCRATSFVSCFASRVRIFSVRLHWEVHTYTITFLHWALAQFSYVARSNQQDHVYSNIRLMFLCNSFLLYSVTKGDIDICAGAERVPWKKLALFWILCDQKLGSGTVEHTRPFDCLACREENI